MNKVHIFKAFLNIFLIWGIGFTIATMIINSIIRGNTLAPISSTLFWGEFLVKMIFFTVFISIIKSCVYFFKKLMISPLRNK